MKFTIVTILPDLVMGVAQRGAGDVERLRDMPSAEQDRVWHLIADWAAGPGDPQGLE